MNTIEKQTHVDIKNTAGVDATRLSARDSLTSIALGLVPLILFRSIRNESIQQRLERLTRDR